jgi:signal transduction histidine kinase
VAERHDVMTDAGLLGASLDYEVTLRRVASLAVPRLADWCTVELSDGANGRGPVPASGVRAVLRSGRVEHYPRIEDEATLRAATGDDAGERERARLHGLGSALIVPLCGARGVVGALALMSARPGRYDRAALGPARELAARAALAVENAMLHAEAERTRRLRDEFVTLAGHELRTPLAALQLQVQGLERATGRAALSPAQLRDRLARLSGNVSRLERLVEGLLDVPRLTTGELGMAPEPLDLAELAHAVIARSSDEARRQRVSLTLRAPDAGVRGRWDRARMEQVLSSLIGNAIKFGAGRPVTVELIDGPECVRVLVRDRGIGIRAPDQRRIFDRFERAVSARHYGGFGLGLWRTRQIVEAQGGRISLRSEPGVETEFAVELPR